MFKIWLKDRSAIDKGLLPYLLGKIAVEQNLPDDQYNKAQEKISTGDFKVEPDPARGGVNLVFGDD